MTDLIAAAQRIVELERKAKLYPGVSEAEHRELLAFYHTKVFPITAEYLRLRKLEEAARRLEGVATTVALRGAQTGPQWVELTLAINEHHRALAALDQHRSKKP